MSNWNTRREEPSIEELTEAVEDFKEQLASALKHGGEGSRDYINTQYMLRQAERQLERAEEREKEREEKSKLTPEQLVDRMMRW